MGAQESKNLTFGGFAHKTRGVSEGQAAGVFGFDEEHAAIKLDDGNRKIEDALLRCGKEHRYPEDSRAWTGFIFKIQFGNDELQIERLCRPIMQFQLDPCGAAAFGKRSFNAKVANTDGNRIGRMTDGWGRQKCEQQKKALNH